MEERFDTERLVARARELGRALRHSDAYPAIIGGIAGGIAGALMAVLVASRFAPRAEPAPESSPAGDRRAGAPAGLDVRQIVQLLAVVAGLIKQAREWYYQERKR